MAFSRSLAVAVAIFGSSTRSAHAQDYFLAKAETTSLNNATVGAYTEGGLRWNDQPCDVNEILTRGDTASFYLYNTFHDEYLSTDGSNVDIWHDKGSHSTWHLKHVEGHTANRFYLQNDWAGGYLSSSGDYNHDNVELWGSRGGRRGGRDDDYSSHRELQWLVFAANELTVGAPKCTFYIMHSDSHKWLDTHGDNVHIWGDHSDIFELGSKPENLQWELHMA